MDDAEGDIEDGEKEEEDVPLDRDDNVAEEEKAPEDEKMEDVES